MTYLIKKCKNLNFEKKKRVSDLVLISDHIKEINEVCRCDQVQVISLQSVFYVLCLYLAGLIVLTFHAFYLDLSCFMSELRNVIMKPTIMSLILTLIFI